MSRVGLSVFFNDTATTEIYTLSLHDALPICGNQRSERGRAQGLGEGKYDELLNFESSETYSEREKAALVYAEARSEEHTSELQSRQYLVCRLLLEKTTHPHSTRRVDITPVIS